MRKYFFYCIDCIPQPQFSRNRHEEAGKLVLYGRQRDGKFSLQPQVWESTQVVRLEEDVGLRLRTIHHGGQLVSSTCDFHFRGIIKCVWDWRAPWFFGRKIRLFSFLLHLRFTISGSSLFVRRGILDSVKILMNPQLSSASSKSFSRR